MSHSLLLIASLALPFVGAVVAGMLPTHARNVAAWLGGGIAVAGVVLTVMALPTIGTGEVARNEIAWMTSQGLNLTLRLAGCCWVLLALMYARGVTGMRVSCLHPST